MIVFNRLLATYYHQQMNSVVYLLQIGDLFAGKFNRRGLIQLVIFLVMGLVVVGFGIWIGINVIRSMKK